MYTLIRNILFLLRLSPCIAYTWRYIIFIKSKWCAENQVCTGSCTNRYCANPPASTINQNICEVPDKCQGYYNSSNIYELEKSCTDNFPYCCGTCDNRYCCSSINLKLNQITQCSTGTNGSDTSWVVNVFQNLNWNQNNYYKVFIDFRDKDKYSVVYYVSLFLLFLGICVLITVKRYFRARPRQTNRSMY